MISTHAPTNLKIEKMVWKFVVQYDGYYHQSEKIIELRTHQCQRYNLNIDKRIGDRSLSCASFVKISTSATIKYARAIL